MPRTNPPSHGAKETRNFRGRVELRVKSDPAGPGVLVGLAAPYYDGTPATEFELWPGVYERYIAGCFDRVGEDDVRCLYNHEECKLLGRTASKTLTLDVTDRGLEYTCELPDTETAREVIALTTRGDLTGSSCGFFVRSERWLIERADDGTEREIRELVDLSVFDVSPVTYPAYAGTEAGTRAASAADEALRSYAAWRAEASTKLYDLALARLSAAALDTLA